MDGRLGPGTRGIGERINKPLAVIWTYLIRQ